MGVSTPTLMRAGTFSVNFPSVREVTSCCGAAGFTEAASASGEIYGVFTLAKYTEVQKAIFALWLNDNPQCWKSVMVAVSAERFTVGAWNEAELVLFESGFIPVSRTLNRNHGPGHITLWYIELTKSTMLPWPEQFQPKKKVKRAISRKD